MLRRILHWTATGLIIAVVLASAAYLWDIDRAYERVRGKGAVIPSPYGNIEYTESGSGPAVLVIHGSGGGYDQGELIAQAVLGGQFHSITPSRFGYLRSTFHEAATWDEISALGPHDVTVCVDLPAEIHARDEFLRRAAEVTREALILDLHAADEDVFRTSLERLGLDVEPIHEPGEPERLTLFARRRVAHTSPVRAEADLRPARSA